MLELIIQLLVFPLSLPSFLPSLFLSSFVSLFVHVKLILRVHRVSFNLLRKLIFSLFLVVIPRDA